MNKKQLIVAWALLFYYVTSASAYVDNYPPYKFKDGAPKHIEAKLIFTPDERYSQPLSQIYRVNLDGNEMYDNILFSNEGGNGLGALIFKVVILLKKRDRSVEKISYETMANDPIKEFIDLNNDGRSEVIITGIYYGDKHNYFTYDIYELKDYRLVNANSKFKGFPKFVWITYKPNDKDTTHLTEDQRMALSKEKDGSIKYGEAK
jgi:hypothetical protein